MYQTNRSKDATDFPIPDYNLLDAGGFFFVKKSFGKADLSGGLRFDNRRIKWDDFYVDTNPQTGFGQQQAVTGIPDARLQFPAFSHQYRGLSGSLGLTYNITERLLLKGNIARGYRAPNITEIGSNGLDPGAHIVYLGNRSFKPEFNLQQDIGLITYMRDATISVEVFNNQIQNYIYQSKLTDETGHDLIIIPGNLTYQYQQSKARLYGAEVSLNIHPEKARWLGFDNTLVYVTGLNRNSEVLNKYGDDARYLPFIPPLHAQSQLTLTAQKQNGLFARPYIRAGVDAYGAQNHFYALDNTETYTKGYSLVNAGLGATVKTRAGNVLYDLFIQVDNLFDIAYQSNLNRLKYFEYYTDSPNGHTGIYNMGRNFSFKIIMPLGK